MRTVIVIENADGAIRRLEAIDRGLTDVSPFLKQAGTLALEASQKNFEAGGRPKWAPLSMTTVLLRAMSFKGYREHKKGKNKGRVTEKTFKTYIAGMNILRHTGLLMASIGNEGKGGVYRLEKDSLTVGTAVRYARYLNDGVQSTKGFIKGKTIPARPFMTLQDADRDRIYDLAVEFVRKQTGNNG